MFNNDSSFNIPRPHNNVRHQVHIPNSTLADLKARNASQLYIKRNGSIGTSTSVSAGTNNHAPVKTIFNVKNYSSVNIFKPSGNKLLTEEVKEKDSNSLMINNYNFHTTLANNNSFNTPVHNNNKLNLQLDLDKIRNKSSHSSQILTKEGACKNSFNPSLSKMLLDNMSNKENMIKNLKSTFTDDKLKRNKLFRTEYDSTTLDKVDSFYENSPVISKNKFGFKTTPKISKEALRPITTTENMNTYNQCTYETTVNNILNNNNISFEINNEKSCVVVGPYNASNPPNCNCEMEKSQHPNNYQKIIKDLEANLEDLLQPVQTEAGNNKTLVNSKKYSIYKKILEELTKSFPEYSKLSGKIIKGLNEIFLELLNESRSFKEKNDNYDFLTTKYYNLKKKYIESTKVVKEKTGEIELLKKRIIELEKNAELSSTNHSKQIYEENPSAINVLSTQSKEDFQEKNENMKTNHNKVIMDINKKVMEDLDALYFFDKVEVKGSSVTPTHIPKLDFNFRTPSNNKKQVPEKPNYVKEETFKITGSQKVPVKNNSSNILNIKKVTNNNYNFNDFVIQKVSSYKNELNLNFKSVLHK